MSRLRKAQGMVAQLGYHWGSTKAEMPEGLRRVADDLSAWSGWNWDAIEPHQRRCLAVQWDAQHEGIVLSRQEIDAAFRAGFKKVSVPNRNKRNASKPRPGAQRIGDTEILDLYRAVSGRPAQKQVGEAFAKLCARGEAPLSLRAFRGRWNALGLKKKKGS